MRRVAWAVGIWVSLAPVAGQAQVAAGGDDAWVQPRTPDGRPDFQGLWTSQTFTPLQRAERFGTRAFLTDEEVAELMAMFGTTEVDPLARSPLLADTADEARDRLEQRDPTHYNNAQWLTTEVPKTLSSNRTSLIVDPPNGRLPALTAEGRARAQALRAARGMDGYHQRPYQERCIVWTHEGPPMIPPPYNDVYQFFQTPEYVVIAPELGTNQVRIIPMDGRPHLPAQIRQWPGDSRGRWDGDTLVVETRNYSAKTAFRGSSEALQVTERFTQVDAETILYEFSVEDPRTWEQPWRAEVPMKATDGRLFEYTCHEGNYGIVNTLRGARRADREASPAESR